MNGHATTPQPNDTPIGMEILPQGTVLIAGGGPVGLTLATVLAFYGVRSVVLERNETTTRCGAYCYRIVACRLMSLDGRRWT